mmetsp:Transcript_2562/g.2963  ORF Transcript_2562/g.2963 Transcript_2562/m.2963 type:complete len:334 (-) Transcript_2562:182-1183(-)
MKKVRKNKIERMRQLTTLTAGMMIGFIMGFSWSNMLLEDDDVGNYRNLAKLEIPETIKTSKINESKTSSRWKIIHVFYGDDSHLYDATDLPESYFKTNTWFSQYRQDEIVSKLLHKKTRGYFIDLAGNDPVRISNTYALEKNFNWNGLCLEPNPIYWTGLSYRKCHVAAAIVGNKTMEQVSFRFPRAKGPKGGIVGDDYDNKSDQWNEGHPRYTVSLLDIFEKFKVPTIIDYISLDIEGAEDLVMKSFPFFKYRFNIMTVERPSSMLSNILSDNGYVMLKIIKKNIETLWVHNSILSTIDKSAIEIDSQSYKYNDNIGQFRIAPEDSPSHLRS